MEPSQHSDSAKFLNKAKLSWVTIRRRAAQQAAQQFSHELISLSLSAVPSGGSSNLGHLGEAKESKHLSTTHSPTCVCMNELMSCITRRCHILRQWDTSPTTLFVKNSTGCPTVFSRADGVHQVLQEVQLAWSQQGNIGSMMTCELNPRSNHTTATQTHHAKSFRRLCNNTSIEAQ